MSALIGLLPCLPFGLFAVTLNVCLSHQSWPRADVVRPTLRSSPCCNGSTAANHSPLETGRKTWIKAPAKHPLQSSLKHLHQSSQVARIVGFKGVSEKMSQDLAPLSLISSDAMVDRLLALALALCLIAPLAGLSNGLITLGVQIRKSYQVRSVRRGIMLALHNTTVPARKPPGYSDDDSCIMV